MPGALPAKNLGGRPTKYRAAYCDEIVQFCGAGYSVSAFAGHIGTCREVLYDWRRQHPEFADAMARARAVRTLWWENRLLSLAMTPNASAGAAATVIFALKATAPEEFCDTQARRHLGVDASTVKVERIERVIIDVTPEPVLIGSDDN